MSERGKEGCIYGEGLLKKCFFKELLHYKTPCLRNSFPLSTTILQAARFFFPTQTVIRKLGHIDDRLHNILKKVLDKTHLHRRKKYFETGRAYYNERFLENILTLWVIMRKRPVSVPLLYLIINTEYWRLVLSDVKWKSENLYENEWYLICF